jgi:antitoxin CptB
MDLVLGRFADAQIESLNETELTELEGWLEIPDQQMFAWVNGMEPAPAEMETGLFQRLRDFRGKGAA